MDQMYVTYGLEHTGLQDEKSRLKADLAHIQALLKTKRSTNSANLKSLFDLLKKDPPSSSHSSPLPSA